MVQAIESCTIFRRSIESFLASIEMSAVLVYRNSAPVGHFTGEFVPSIVATQLGVAVLPDDCLLLSPIRLKIMAD